MKLFMAGASPYARKVLVLACERGLRERIEPVLVNPHDRPPELVAANPLSRVPTLIADDGSVHIDSFAICLFLDALAAGPQIALPDRDEKWDALRRTNLANGVLECSVTRRVESLKTPEPDRKAWMHRQKATTERVLDCFEQAVDALEGRVALDTITLACGLSYLDFRFPDDGWRNGRPRLADWHARFEQRPSMQATQYFA